MRSFLAHFAIAGVLTAAWIVAQPPLPPGSGMELAFPKFSTPPVCDVGRSGRVYYDTDDNLPYFCNGTIWTTFTFSISGTFPKVARFNSAGTNIENSIIEASGIPAAGAGGSVVLVAGTLNAMDGSDTIKLLDIDFTNGSHSGASNILRAVYVDGITGSANADEEAIFVSSGWDSSFVSVGGAFDVAGSTPTAGANYNLLKLGGALQAMNGSDTIRIINTNNLNNADHTGSGNNLYYLDIVGITGDAQATETALEVRAGWDRGLVFTDDTGNQAHLYWDDPSIDAIFDSQDANPDYDFKGNGVTLASFQDGQEITHLMATDLTVSGSNQTVDPNANVVEITASSAASVSAITAPTATNHTERITFICRNANITFNDADAGGAAGTIDLVGTAVGLVCTEDDTLTVVYYVAPNAGNARWVEVSRSVN